MFRRLLNDKSKLVPCLATALVNLFKLGNTSPFKILKKSTIKKIKDFLINKNIPATFHDNLLTFHDSNKKFELKEQHLKIIFIINSMMIISIYRIGN